MKWLRNFKIGARLYGMFSLVVVALLLIAFSGVISRLDLIKKTESLKQNYIDHMQMLADVNVTTGNLFLSYRNYYLEYPDQDKMQVRLNDINKRTDFVVTNLQDYQKSLEARNAPAEELANVKSAITKVQNEVVPFNEKITKLMQSDKIEEAHQLIISDELRKLRSTLQDDLISQIYTDCVNNAELIMDANVLEMKSSNMLIIVLVAVGLFIVVLFAVMTVRSLVVPTNALVSMSGEIAHGHIDINLPPLAHDEMGELTRQFGEVSTVLRGLINEMSEMAAKHQAGQINARINETRYEGAYRDVAVGINGMIGSYLQHMNEMCLVLQEFGHGDFNVQYAQLPGEKAVLNQVIEELRKNLKEIDEEVETLSEAAVNGELHKRVNPDKFRGDWQKLMKDLNAVMDSVITPITEASDVLREMSEGRLQTRVTGEYKGDFTIIKDSLNSTQAALSSYISEISTVLGEVAGQNLAVTINRPYIGDFSIIKDSINLIVKTFNETLTDFNTSADRVSMGAKQIADASANLSNGAATQASAVEELNAAIDHVSSQTNQNAQTALKANQLTLEAKTNAESEADMMQAMLSAMKGINESSVNISKIIKVIDDISFQTNLLALNAAVEAARAGEHGKGFAVVAEEVRNLASRSQEAARNTTELIEDSTRKASDGARIAGETAKGLETVVSQIAEISGYINTIAKASKEQNESIEDISQGITQVSQVTQSNTAISQESAASSEELASQAEIFRNTVSKFKLR